MIPPMRSVRLPGGRSRIMSLRPEEPSGKAYVSLLTLIEGSASWGAPLGSDMELFRSLSCWLSRSQREAQHSVKPVNDSTISRNWEIAGPCIRD